MYQVKGKWALITGAARGIGYLSAKFMAQQGVNLILHSRSLSHTEKVLGEVLAMGVQARAVEADLNDLKCPKCRGNKLIPLTGRDLTLKEILAP